MTKYFLKLSLVALLVLTTFGCADEDEDPRTGRRRREPAELPAKGTKIAFIFPAGAGAMLVSLGITEALEAKLGLTDGIGSVINLAGGVSSGSLVAGGLTLTTGGANDKPQYTSAQLKSEIIKQKLVSSVFPHINALVTKLQNDYGFTLDELEAVFLELMKSHPNLTSQAEAEKSFGAVLAKAAGKKVSMASKIKEVDKRKDLGPFLTNIANKGAFRRDQLKATIKTLFGSFSIGDPQLSKLIAIASSQQKPVFFAHPNIRNIPEPYAVSTTKWWKGFVASACIPGFFEAPNDIVFEPKKAVITDLEDGFFATGVGFDPSAVYFDIFTKEFAGDDLLIVYVGNGAPPNLAFRKTHRFNRDNVYQEKKGNRKITMVAIDAKIVDDQKNSLFGISQFYEHAELQKYMADAAQEATKSKAFDWAVKGISAAIKGKVR